MHEPDRPPHARLISDKRYTVQWMANLSLFGGVALSVLGALLSIVTGNGAWYFLLVGSMAFAALTMRLSREAGAERARATAGLAIAIISILFFIALVLFVFFREAAGVI